MSNDDKENSRIIIPKIDVKGNNNNNNNNAGSNTQSATSGSDESNKLSKLKNSPNFDKLNIHTKHSKSPEEKKRKSFNFETIKNYGGNNNNSKKNSPARADLSKERNIVLMTQLKKIGEKSIGYKWMHNYEKEYYEKNEGIYKIWEIILLAIIGTITGGEFVAFTSEFAKVLNAASTNILVTIIIFWGINTLKLIISLIYAVVKGLKDSGDFPKKIYDHQYTCAKFNEIYMDIQNQFTLSVKNREIDSSFLQNKTKEFNELMQTAPKIRRSTINKYIKATENEDIYKPLLVGEFDKIEIVIDEDKDNVNLRVTKNNPHDMVNNTTGFDSLTQNKAKYQISRWLKNI